MEVPPLVRLEALFRILKGAGYPDNGQLGRVLVPYVEFPSVTDWTADHGYNALTGATAAGTPIITLPLLGAKFAEGLYEVWAVAVLETAHAAIRRVRLLIENEQFGVVDQKATAIGPAVGATFLWTPFRVYLKTNYVLVINLETATLLNEVIAAGMSVRKVL